MRAQLWQAIDGVPNTAPIEIFEHADLATTAHPCCQSAMEKQRTMLGRVQKAAVRALKTDDTTSQEFYCAFFMCKIPSAIKRIR